jgi:hypothetical protein
MAERLTLRTLKAKGSGLYYLVKYIIAVMVFVFAYAGVAAIATLVASKHEHNNNWLTVDATVLTVEDVAIEGHVLLAHYVYDGKWLYFYSDTLQGNSSEYLPETVTVSFDPDNNENYIVDTGGFR